MFKSNRESVYKDTIGLQCNSSYGLLKLQVTEKWCDAVCEIMVKSNFIYRLVLCSHGDVSFNIMCLNMLDDIKQLYSLIWFKSYRLETLFKGDNLIALIKTSNYENMVIYFSKKVQHIATFSVFFLFFSDQTIP